MRAFFLVRNIFLHHSIALSVLVVYSLHVFPLNSIPSLVRSFLRLLRCSQSGWCAQWNVQRAVCLFSFLFKRCSNSLFCLSLHIISSFSLALFFFFQPAIINKFLHGFFLNAENFQRKLHYVLQWNRIKYAAFLHCSLYFLLLFTLNISLEMLLSLTFFCYFLYFALLFFERIACTSWIERENVFKIAF